LFSPFDIVIDAVSDGFNGEVLASVGGIHHDEGSRPRSAYFADQIHSSRPIIEFLVENDDIGLRSGFQEVFEPRFVPAGFEGHSVGEGFFQKSVVDQMKIGIIVDEKNVKVPSRHVEGDTLSKDLLLDWIFSVVVEISFMQQYKCLRKTNGRRPT